MDPLPATIAQRFLGVRRNAFAHSGVATGVPCHSHSATMGSMCTQERDRLIVRDVSPEGPVRPLVREKLEQIDFAAMAKGVRLCGRPGVTLRIFDHRSALEASIARRILVVLRTDAIDESHVNAGECPCRGRIELRTLHKNLPESQRT